MRRSGRSAAAACVAVGLVLAACSPGNDLKTGTPTASASAPLTFASSSPSIAAPTVPADVPLTGHNLNYKDEKPPVMPVLATMHTEAGATAFAKFYVQTIDWGYAVSSPTYMAHYTASTCAACEEIISGLKFAQDKRANYRGARITITSVHSDGAGGPFGAEFSVTVVGNSTSWALVDSSDKTLAFDKAYTGASDRIWLKWTPPGWSVVDLKVTLK